jgi:hypothetical protein
MKKVSETGGYSALHSALETIEKLIDDAAFLDEAVGEVVEAMARGARSGAVRAAASVEAPTSSRAFPRALRDAVVSELRKLVVSESFMSPLRRALSGLRPVVDEISDPVESSPMPAFDQTGSSRDVLTRAWSVAGELVRGQSGALREAVEEVVTLSLLLDGLLLSAIPGIVKGFSGGVPSDADVKAALSESLRPLQESVQRVKVQLDAARGFAVFETAKSKRPSLALFLSLWRGFRAGTPSVAVGELAEAIVANDLARLGALIGGRDAARIQIDVSKLPLDLPRRPGQPTIGLLDISAAVGGAPLRYLLEFFSLKPTIDTLHQAIASGDNESIHMIWSRVDEKIMPWVRRELAKTAAEFHFVGVVNWILRDAPHRTREVVREFAIEHRLIDAILGMAGLPPVAEDAPVLAELPAGSLLARNEAKLERLGVKFSKPELLMEKREMKWGIYEFLQNVGSVAPTLLLVEMKNGTECGGVAGVPWPPQDREAKDPSKVSCIFSLGATPTRFGLVSADDPAIFSGAASFGFGKYSVDFDFVVWPNGSCGVNGRRCYAGPLGAGTLIGTAPAFDGPYARWELWRL